MTAMCEISVESKEKIGNAMIYIANRLQGVSKTKLLKLLYLMEERMVEKYHVPFLALPYEIWRLGPVQKELFAELSDQPLFLFKEYIEPYYDKDDNKYFRALKPFDDDEFSDCELMVMDEVMKEYGGKTARQLIDILHQPGTLWHKGAVAHNVLASFNKGTCNSTDIKIDFSAKLPEDIRSEYEESLSVRQTADALKVEFHV
ncbi:MAG: SocA family protein [Bacteroidales bacterium]|nr:SocA family protein [Bacteroidales bacterium]